ncbi:MAG TPA: hypothetical protein PKH69_00490 [Thiobacillaceae bacterium]|nr:hypothetical protein [Thiobacillaceae bacterium]HNU63409.1 hypothetical protein [Thiobacillaceae bacterium]
MAQHSVKYATVLLAGVLAQSVGASWELTGLGDCPGPQVWNSAGELPEAERCTPEFAGKTALCFAQVCYPSCRYIDVPTRECKGGTGLDHLYTCVPDLSGAR